MNKELILGVALVIISALTISVTENSMIVLFSVYVFYHAFLGISGFITQKEKKRLAIYFLISLVPLALFMQLEGINLVAIGLTSTHIFLSVFLSAVVFLVVTFIHIYHFYLRRPSNVFDLRLPTTKDLFLSASSAVSEEIWHRGLLLFLAVAALGTHAAVLINTLVFFFPHLKRNKFSGFLSAIFGFFSAIIVITTGNILGPILAHFLFNLFNNYMICPKRK